MLLAWGLVGTTPSPLGQLWCVVQMWCKRGASGVTILDNEKNQAGGPEGNLLANPAFLKYLAGLPVQSFRGLLVVNGETGKAMTIISKREGDNLPNVHVASEE